MIAIKAAPLSRRCWVAGLRPEVVLGLMVCHGAAVSKGMKGLQLTSGTDSLHSRHSLHYAGQAVDFNLLEPASGAEKRVFLALCRELLGPDFDLLLEAEGTPNEHFHLEFQPERP